MYYLDNQIRCIYSLLRTILRQRINMMCRKLRQNIETTSAHFSKSAHYQPTTGCRQIIPVTIQYSILKESQSRLETHLGERTDIALETHSVEWRETTTSGHMVANQVQVSFVDGNTVRIEDTKQFSNNVVPSCLNTIDLQNGGNVIGLDAIRVNKIAVPLHGLQVDT